MAAGEAGCVTLWVGPALGPIERACLRSIMRQGHPLALYCYAPPDGLPEGVEVREAAEILPRARIDQRWADRPDLYSDWFRYELLRRGLGTWVDTDIYLLRPLDQLRPYLFGRQDGRILNNAVLRAPADSPLLSALLEPFLRRTTPRWLPWRSFIPMRARELVTGGADLTRAPWGTTSPHALTALAASLKLEQWAEPPERFYPVPWQRADWILDPGLTLSDVVVEETVAVHLWNECIKGFKHQPPPTGSFLEQLHREGAL